MNKLTRFSVFIAIIFTPITSMAFSWQDLWSRPDEQAAVLLKKGKAAAAAEKFQNRDWQGVAYYRAGKYSDAAQTFAKIDTSFGHYNRGNAMAHLGQYHDAIKAYEEAILRDPNNSRAKKAKAILEKLLKQAKHKKQEQTANSQQQQKLGQKNSNQLQNKQSQQRTRAQSGTQQQNQQNSKSSSPNSKQKQSIQAMSASAAQRRKQHQAAKQWLRRIQDDPGGLLKQKFQRDHLRRQHRM